MRHVELAGRRLRNAVVRTRLSLASDPPALDPELASIEAARADRILFVCLGNVCRSPMAERYARKRLDEAGAGVEVESAGFVDREGRASPGDAVDAAAARGVDLSGHRSSRLTGEVLEASDVVFVMDVRNYRDLQREFGPTDAGVYFLGSLAGLDGRFEVPDPHGAGPGAFASAYDDVVAAVEALVDAVAARRADLPGESGRPGVAGE